tara:strand:- start:1462 stop:2061 length:600 start_codon:yes stop_codon:yes gene_type:complete
MPNIYELVKEFCVTILHTFLYHKQVYFQENSILVILDPITAYRNLYNKKDINNLCKLIINAKKKEIPIVLTRWIRTKPETASDAIEKKGHWSFFVPNKYQTQIIDEIINETSDYQNVYTVNVKNTNAFMSEKFKSQTEDKKHIIIAGCWTESCVLNTARSALDFNKQVSVVKNCCVGHFIKHHISLFTIQLLYGDILTI